MRNLFVLFLNVILFLFLIYQVNHFNNGGVFSDIFRGAERNNTFYGGNTKNYNNGVSNSSGSENQDGFASDESYADDGYAQRDNIYDDNSNFDNNSGDNRNDVSSGSSNLSDLELNRKLINAHIGENYLDAILSRGLLTRWNPSSFPLVVYISPEIPQNFFNEIRNAFNKWQSATDNYIRFVYTNHLSNANIKCVLNDKSGNRKLGEHSCEAASAVIVTTNDKTLNEVTINVYTKDCKGNLWTNNAFYSGVLHEIGHALGLAGHSNNIKDVMYPYMKGPNYREDISKADMNTLKAVYSIIPDVTNIPFSEDEKQGLILSKDYWGENKYRNGYKSAGVSINENASAFNSLIIDAKKHENNREYTKAIYSYEKALSYADSDDLQYKIKMIIVQDYLQINQLNNAEKLLKEIAINKRDNNIAILYNIIATKYLKTNNYKKSEDLLNTGLRFATEKKTIKMLYNNLCYVAVKLKDYEMYKKYEKVLKSL